MPRNIMLQVLGFEFVKNMDIEEKISLIARVFNVTKKKATIRIKEVENV